MKRARPNSALHRSVSYTAGTLSEDMEHAAALEGPSDTLTSKRGVMNGTKAGGRTRPTNNQLLYKAYLRWEHYSHSLHGDPTLPTETEACASVTSAFLQVMSILFEVESLRLQDPRNILQILSTNTRRTKVVELSSGTHRVPDELRRHSLTDGVGGQYSTNLDRNRYGADDQYLSTVIRYDLDFLKLCPCLVDVEIIDAKNGSGTILVSAGEEICTCSKDPARKAKGKDGEQAASQRVLQSVSVVPWPTADSAKTPRSAAAAAAAAAAASAAAAAGPGGSARPDSAAPVASAAAANAHNVAVLGSAAKSNGGSELFDALLMAATGGGNKGGQQQQPQQQQPAGAGEEAQVSSKPTEWPLPQPTVKRQRSRLHQSPTGVATTEQNPPTTSMEAMNGQKIAQTGRRGSAGMLNALNSGVGKERSGENGVTGDYLNPSIIDGIDQGSYDAMDLGDLDNPDFALVRASLNYPNGASANGVNYAGMSKSFKDAELKRLDEEVKTLRATRTELESQLEEVRVKEMGAQASASALRADLEAHGGAPSSANTTQTEEKKVLGQQTWEAAQQRMAQRAHVSVPRMVSVLRVEVQRLNAARQEAEARAAASQAVAEAAQRELAEYLAKGSGPQAEQARHTIDTEKAQLRQQLQEARAALQRAEAERSALEECLAVTSAAPVSSSAMALQQPAPVTPQPHRNANPTATTSDGSKKAQQTSPDSASGLLATSMRTGSQTTPSDMPSPPSAQMQQAPAAPLSQAALTAMQDPAAIPSSQALPPQPVSIAAGPSSTPLQSPAPAAAFAPADYGAQGAAGQIQDPLAAFMSIPMSKELAEAQAAVAAVASALPGLTPQQIIYNAAIAMSQAMIAHAQAGFGQPPVGIASSQSDAAAAAVLEAQLSSYLAALQPQVGLDPMSAVAEQVSAAAMLDVPPQPQQRESAAEAKQSQPAPNVESATKEVESGSGFAPAQPAVRSATDLAVSGGGEVPVSAVLADVDVSHMLNIPATSQAAPAAPVMSTAPVQ